MVEEENQLRKVVLKPPHVRCGLVCKHIGTILKVTKSCFQKKQLVVPGNCSQNIVPRQQPGI